MLTTSCLLELVNCKDIIQVYLLIKLRLSVDWTLKELNLPCNIESNVIILNNNTNIEYLINPEIWKSRCTVFIYNIDIE